MRVIRLVVAVLALAGGGVVFTSQPAECAYCPTYPCFGSCASDDCICLVEPGEVKGRCVSAGFVEGWKAEGWERMEVRD